MKHGQFRYLLLYARSIFVMPVVLSVSLTGTIAVVSASFIWAIVDFPAVGFRFPGATALVDSLGDSWMVYGEMRFGRSKWVAYASGDASSPASPHATIAARPVARLLHCQVDGEVSSAIMYQSGWPLVYFAGYKPIEPNGKPSKNIIECGPRVVPYGAVWTNIGSTAMVVHLGIVFAVAVLASAVRALRRARGVCQRCTYPLDALIRCPECGLDAPRRGTGEANQSWMRSS